jgi:Flp pilus assembly protein TadG
MTLGASLLRDESGATMVETAFALPVLIIMIWGIFQFGIALHAQAGMQHALGEGARFATLCINPTITTGCSRPTDTQIVARMNAVRFGTGYGTFGTPTVTPPAAGENFLTLAVSYEMPINFLFFPGPTVTFAQSKRVYVAG